MRVQSKKGSWRHPAEEKWRGRWVCWAWICWSRFRSCRSFSPIASSLRCMTLWSSWSTWCCSWAGLNPGAVSGGGCWPRRGCAASGTASSWTPTSRWVPGERGREGWGAHAAGRSPAAGGGGLGTALCRLRCLLFDVRFGGRGVSRKARCFWVRAKSSRGSGAAVSLLCHWLSAQPWPRHLV